MSRSVPPRPSGSGESAVPRLGVIQSPRLAALPAEQRCCGSAGSVSDGSAERRQQRNIRASCYITRPRLRPALSYFSLPNGMSWGSRAPVARERGAGRAPALPSAPGQRSLCPHLAPGRLRSPAPTQSRRSETTRKILTRCSAAEEETTGPVPSRIEPVRWVLLLQLDPEKQISLDLYSGTTQESCNPPQYDWPDTPLPATAGAALHPVP